MDATVSEKQGAQQASEGTTSAPEVRRAPSSELAVAVAGGSVKAEESGAVDGEEDQVERFYALLANIRALRSVYGAAGRSARKRPRVADEPPWRPRFRMEDFMEVDDAVSTAKKGRNDTGERQRQDDDEAPDGEVVQENDRVSTSQSTRVCADLA